MTFQIKKRGKLTYYSSGEKPVLSALVTQDEGDGNLRIHFSGLTGGHSSTGILGLNEVHTMTPSIEVELVFRCWERWLQKAEICNSIQQIDFIELHAFAAQPKSPNPMVDPEGFAEEQRRLYGEYAEAYSNFFYHHMPDCGVPSRFTVHVVDFPDKAASYEFYSVGLYQPSLH